MKTIEIIINDQKAEFTTKSMTFEGKEYFYSNMTDLHHSPIVLTYSFDYDGETKRLTYKKKDAKVLAAIFGQVQKLAEHKKEKAAVEEPKQPEAKIVDEVKPEAAEPSAGEAEKAETAAPAEADAAEKTDDTKAEDTEKSAEESKNKKSLKDIFASLKPKKEAGEEGENAEAKEEAKEKEPMDPEKQASLKKSLKVFAIILGVVLAASIVYYFVFGTAKAPSDANPNVTESQQYDDIDQLINDLQ